MTDCIPKHGPGAVANPSVKSRLEKYLTMEYDARINYLLQKDEGCYGMGDFCPFPLQDQSRTSRVVFVPKSWKKLRGISAEPAGLQYFQQAVNTGIQNSLKRCYLDRVINLRDQDTSREMALRGSDNGSLATIDLSAASDSVTLRIVKDIFGHSLLCRWLLATRSTHTLLYKKSLKINKFAPMGSACCFPVECLIFAGICLASAAKNSDLGRYSIDQFRVYGDDIICPAVLADGIMADLTLMGFTVNSDKSYVSGDYRESCGMDAWRGFDVTPLKLKDFSFDLDGSKPLSYEHHSRLVSYLNALALRGYHKVRSFLLKKLLFCTITMRGQKHRGKTSLLFGDGSRGSILSSHPTNFHLTSVPLKGLFRSGYSLIGWKPRYERLSPKDELLWSEVLYFENLLSFRANGCENFVTYDLEFFKNLEQLEIPNGPKPWKMVPVLRTYDPWYPDEE